jgi:ribonuclease HII
LYQEFFQNKVGSWIIQNPQIFITETKINPIKKQKTKVPSSLVSDGTKISESEPDSLELSSLKCSISTSIASILAKNNRKNKINKENKQIKYAHFSMSFQVILISKF